MDPAEDPEVGRAATPTIEKHSITQSAPSKIRYHFTRFVLLLLINTRARINTQARFVPKYNVSFQIANEPANGKWS